MAPVPSPQEDQRFLAAALLLALACVWFAHEPPTFYGTDAACYARVAQELLTRPLWQWAHVTLGGGDFYEHPPLGHMGIALAFMVGGANAMTAWVWARLLMTVSILAQVRVAWRLAGWRTAAWCVLAPLTLADFFYESTNSMLESPLVTCMSLAVMGAVESVFQTAAWRSRLGVALFAAGMAAGWMVKGPPGMVLLVVPAFLAWRGRMPWKRAVAVDVLGVAATLGVALLFDAWRLALGLESFWKNYLRIQVFPSVVSGRHNPVTDPFFYLRFMATYHVTLLLSVVAALVLLASWWRRKEAPLQRDAMLLGLLWCVSIVGGFSIPRQQYGWYLATLLPGAAWLMGSVLSSVVPVRADVWMTRASTALAALWVVSSFLFVRPAPEARRILDVVAHTPRPDTGGRELVVVNCSALDPWKADHAFRFYWGAPARECQDPHAYDGATHRFDGTSLQALVPQE